GYASWWVTCKHTHLLGQGRRFRHAALLCLPSLCQQRYHTAKYKKKHRPGCAKAEGELSQSGLDVPVAARGFSPFGPHCLRIGERIGHAHAMVPQYRQERSPHGDEPC